MRGWLRWMRAGTPEPLRGVPEAPRVKNYSAESGYVYQYVYKGYRPDPDGTEYVFSLSADRKNYLNVSVLVRDEALRDWEHRHDRTLSATERFGAAKLALRQALDERERPADLAHRVEVRAADLAAILENLAVE